MAENMELLLDTGAAELPDVGGMLPMHYACAYGVESYRPVGPCSSAIPTVSFLEKTREELPCILPW